MRETNVDVVGESTSSRLSSTNSETLINPGMADVCYFHRKRQKNSQRKWQRDEQQHTHDEIIKKKRRGIEKHTHTTPQTTKKDQNGHGNVDTPLRMKLFFLLFFFQQNSAMLLFSRLNIIVSLFFSGIWCFFLRLVGEFRFVLVIHW